MNDTPTPLETHRILVIDDMASIHEDFRKILTVSEEEALSTMILLAEDKLSRKKLAAWIRERMAPD